MDSGTQVSVEVQAGPEGMGHLEDQLHDQLQAIICFAREDWAEDVHGAWASSAHSSRLGSWAPFFRGAPRCAFFGGATSYNFPFGCT